MKPIKIVQCETNIRIPGWSNLPPHHRNPHDFVFGNDKYQGPLSVHEIPTFPGTYYVARVMKSRFSLFLVLPTSFLPKNFPLHKTAQISLKRPLRPSLPKSSSFCVWAQINPIIICAYPFPKLTFRQSSTPFTTITRNNFKFFRSLLNPLRNQNTPISIDELENVL